MGGGHPGLAAIAARSEVSPINRRIVLTTRPSCRSRILEHARQDRGLCTAARFSSFASALPPLSIIRLQPARVSPPGKRRLRIFAASVRMTQHSSTAVRRLSPRPLRKNSRPSAQRVGKRYAVGEDLCTDHTVSDGPCLNVRQQDANEWRQARKFQARFSGLSVQKLVWSAI